MSKRTYTPGPHMVHAMEIAFEQPRIRKTHLARKIGPHGSVCYGCRSIDRAIKRGYLANVSEHRYFTEIEITEKGREYLQITKQPTEKGTES
jgi:hypothetical protein